MKWYVVKAPQWKSKFELHTLNTGWGNGYVAVPPSHCLHGVGYVDRIVDIKLHVHGGITYSQFGNGENAPRDWWVFGFDCMHWNDNLDNWPKEAVIEETMNLFWQLVELEWGGL